MPSVATTIRTDGDLASTLRLSVVRLTRRLRAERDPDNELLPVGQLSVLGVLSQFGQCTVGELAAIESVQPPSMTRTVKCLVEGGYVIRREHETDRRHVLVTLSPKGTETLAADRRRRDAWLAQKLRELTPADRDVLRQAAPLIERLTQA